MFPQKVHGQRDLENTKSVIPPSENHNVLCLVKGPGKSYHKIASACFSNSQTFDHRNFIFVFPSIKHLSEHQGTQCRGNPGATLNKDHSSHSPSAQHLIHSLSTVTRVPLSNIYIITRSLPSICEHVITRRGSTQRRAHAVHPTDLWVQPRCLR